MHRNWRKPSKAGPIIIVLPGIACKLLWWLMCSNHLHPFHLLIFCFFNCWLFLFVWIERPYHPSSYVPVWPVFSDVAWYSAPVSYMEWCHLAKSTYKSNTQLNLYDISISIAYKFRFSQWGYENVGKRAATILLCRLRTFLSNVHVKTILHLIYQLCVNGMREALYKSN